MSGLKNVFKSFLPLNKDKGEVTTRANLFKISYLIVAGLIAASAIATCFFASALGFSHLLMLAACLYIYANSTCPTASARPKADYFRSISLIGSLIVGGLFITSILFPVSAAILTPIIMGCINLVTMSYATTACLDLTTAERVKDPIKVNYYINSFLSIAAIVFSAIAPFVGLNIAMMGLACIFPIILASEIIYSVKFRGQEPSVKKLSELDLEGKEISKKYTIKFAGLEALKSRSLDFLGKTLELMKDSQATFLPKMENFKDKTTEDLTTIENDKLYKYYVKALTEYEEIFKDFLVLETSDNTSPHTDAVDFNQAKFYQDILKSNGALRVECDGCYPTNPRL